MVIYPPEKKKKKKAHSGNVTLWLYTIVKASKEM